MSKTSQRDISECEASLVHKWKDHEVPRKMSENGKRLPYIDKCDSSSHLPNDHADAMDMDHIYLSFFDFLWACTFVFPSSHVLALKGTITLVTRAYAAKLGIYRRVHQQIIEFSLV